jgi:hypothetical protein
MKAWWNDKAKPWLKRNWKWIVLPVGVLMAILQLIPRRRVLQASSEIAGAAKVERDAKGKATAAIVEATVTKEEAIKVIEEEHEETIKELTDAQKGKVERLREKPDELNAFLKNVGQSARRRSRGK